MLKMASESFIHALLLFLGLFLKITGWVPLYATWNCQVILPLMEDAKSDNKMFFLCLNWILSPVIQLEEGSSAFDKISG